MVTKKILNIERLSATRKPSVLHVRPNQGGHIATWVSICYNFYREWRCPPWQGKWPIASGICVTRTSYLVLGPINKVMQQLWIGFARSSSVMTWSHFANVRRTAELSQLIKMSRRIITSQRRYWQNLWNCEKAQTCATSVMQHAIQRPSKLGPCLWLA